MHLLNLVNPHLTRVRLPQIMPSALVGDHLFVLHKELHDELQLKERHIRILDYQAQTVKVKTHECYPLNQCDWKELNTLRLDACEGSLMVTAYNMEYSGLGSGYKHERAWQYDLCTGEWKPLPL